MHAQHTTSVVHSTPTRCSAGRDNARGEQSVVDIHGFQSLSMGMITDNVDRKAYHHDKVKNSFIVNQILREHLMEFQ
eukprot:gene6031-4333_t